MLKFLKLLRKILAGSSHHAPVLTQDWDTTALQYISPKKEVFYSHFLHAGLLEVHLNVCQTEIAQHRNGKLWVQKKAP